MINISPIELKAPWLDARFEVRIVKVKNGVVTISAGGREYLLHEGDTFDFTVKLS